MNKYQRSQLKEWMDPIRQFAGDVVGVRAGRQNLVSLEHWFYDWIDRQNGFAKKFSPKNVYFEFGVASGDSLLQYIQAAKKWCTRAERPLTDFRIVLFDSFQGLPPKTDIGDEHIAWSEGLFANSRHDIENKLKAAAFPLEQVTFVEGFFEESLTTKLCTQFKQEGLYPSIVNVDVDYYSSTKTAMDWMLPLLSSGCTFYFDDYWAFHGHPDMGQIRVIREFNDSGNGQLVPCNIFGLDHQSYLYTKPKWEWV
ncbi:MAG: TylF/MycF family methyltransferase [Myxococcales bacterium]|nr:TylF/MycF family methyltransferase [Myxococcales bacterium]